MTFPLRTLRARSLALNTTSQGERPMRRLRLHIAVSAVNAALLMLVPTPPFPRSPRARRLVLAGMVLLAAALAPAPASAHFEGGKWPTSSVPGRLLRISYDSTCTRFADVVDTAASSWSTAVAGTPHPVWLRKFPPGLACAGVPGQRLDVLTRLNPNPRVLDASQKIMQHVRVPLAA
jgi:hypothetical protein